MPETAGDLRLFRLTGFSMAKKGTFDRNPIAGCEKPKLGFRMGCMKKSLYEFVMAELRAALESDLTYEQIADGSGVNKRTVEKIARREIKDAGVSHIQKLADYFSRAAARSQRPKEAVRAA